MRTIAIQYYDSPCGTLVLGSIAARLCLCDWTANGANPISIFVPCHRVIGSNGTLTGYGGGTAVKQWLLQLELSGKIVPTQRPIP